MKDKIKTNPKEIFSEYKNGNEYKSSIGESGILEQTKINERFFVGDQWYGAQCGNKRPLVRRNVIKRIGDYKISSIGAAPVTVNYSADGVPDTKNIKKDGEKLQNEMLSDGYTFPKETPTAPEISVVTDALSKYQKVCAERVQFNLKNEQLLRNAYISGTGVAYTYWDNDIDTGLYADISRTKKIKGDIAFEILDVENVIFGDPNNTDVQTQPYILIAQRLDVTSVRREARKNGLVDDDIVADGNSEYNSGDRGESEPSDSRRVTVLTKLYKEWDKNDNAFKVMAVKTTEKAFVKKPWDIGLSMYPIAVFQWERRRSCVYGDSEITYLIPNQIAINRMLTAQCWSALSVGMPKLLVNNDCISEDTKITNDPGQIIRVNVGYENGMNNAMKYLAPAPWLSQYQVAVNDLSANTLGDSGANDAALGNLRPDNASAIIQMREAALQPMQVYQNRYYAFIEEIARIWADFWLKKYGKRSLKVVNRDGVNYMPFDAERYKNLILTARVDVGASTMWSESVVISTLNNLLEAQIITPRQFLERIPQGFVPKLTELIEDIRKQEEATTQVQDGKDRVLQQFAQQYPQEYAEYAKLSPEEQDKMLQQIIGGAAQ
jgi:hypothetical protein